MITLKPCDPVVKKEYEHYCRIEALRKIPLAMFTALLMFILSLNSLGFEDDEDRDENGELRE